MTGNGVAKPRDSCTGSRSLPLDARTAPRSAPYVSRPPWACGSYSSSPLCQAARIVLRTVDDHVVGNGSRVCMVARVHGPFLP